MPTPNNFKVTDAIGETDNFIGADINFYHITLKDNSASVVDVRTELGYDCLLYTSPSPRDPSISRMPSSA